MKIVVKINKKINIKQIVDGDMHNRFSDCN